MVEHSSKVAFVTGASRGIGKQAALALAAKGFDVVITARTAVEGEQHERGGHLSDVTPVAGSLETTAAGIRALGRQALPIRLDLLDPCSVEHAVTVALERWGRIDLLLNNGIYQGPGTMSRFMELTAQQLHNIYQGNVFSPVLLTQLCLQSMLKRGHGCIINVVSESGMIDPRTPVGEGGWGFAYSSAKAALTRMIGVLKVEHQHSGIRFHNLEPGFVITELVQAKGMAAQFERFGGVPPTVPAQVIGWLASSEDASEYHGKTLFAQKFFAEFMAGEKTASR
ncbi:SDR family NAD(P)-dependent oxidoreductase [Shewanella sp. GXUN23E]|uniref:SDR family NAD(P)-dependent oxidoreductase n=1 Tax=Shewanella sp. GXUN23E TaxID=3422498 RepID=UPI003D7D1DE0